MCYLPGLYILGLNDCQRRFLNSLGKNSVPLISQMVAIAFHLLWSYLFVNKLGYGIEGTGIAGTLTNSTALLMNYGYTLYLSPDISEAVFLPDRRCFYGIGEYMKIGIPSAVMICLDGWAWHLMSFTSGYFGVNDQAAMIVVMNIVIMCY